MARVAPLIALSHDEEVELRATAGSGQQPGALRAAIVLAAATGATNKVIAEQLGTSAPTVGHWRDRFAREGVSGLLDAPRPGRPADDTSVETVLAKAAEPPPDGDDHWSVRRLARATGLPPSTVHRIWRAHRRHPELEAVRGLDLPVAARVCTVVGLFADPPAGLVVIDVAEPERRREPATAPLAPVDGEGPGAVAAFLRRCGVAATGQVLVIATEESGPTDEVRQWTERHPGAALQLVPTLAWQDVAETWLGACSAAGRQAAADELAGALRRAAGSGGAAWVVELGGQVPEDSSR